MAHLRRLHRAGAMGEWKVLREGVEGRICGPRKSEAAIRLAHRRIERRAAKKQSKTQPETWEYAKYVAVFTVDLSTAPQTILEWYRVRWQIELIFKRLKILAQLGHLPKYNAQSSRAWLYGKLLVALLTHKLVRTGREISPGATFSTDTRQRSEWREFSFARHQTSGGQRASSWADYGPEPLEPMGGSAGREPPPTNEPESKLDWK